MEATGGCCLCEIAAETIGHLFCECPMVTQLWIGFEEFLNGSFVQVTERFLCSVVPLKAIEMAARLWTIWSARNDKLWNVKVWSLVDLKRNVAASVSSWSQAYVFSSVSTPVAPINAVDNWCVPPVGYLKCNVDASLTGNLSGFGAVIRDHAGWFVAAYGGLHVSLRIICCNVLCRDGAAMVPRRSVRTLSIQGMNLPVNRALTQGLQQLTHLTQTLGSVLLHNANGGSGMVGVVSVLSYPIPSEAYSRSVNYHGIQQIQGNM
nr:uncharacterized protein LOC109164732 [Ipomoea trifida]